MVKNAYDANALNLKITFQNDTLRFEDNGIGMNADDIKKHWMHIGKSSKEYRNRRFYQSKRRISSFRFGLLQKTI